MSFANPRQPKLSQIGTVPAGERMEAIDRDTLLTVAGTAEPGRPAVRDYLVVDASNQENLQTLSTVKMVKATLEKDDTGTTFLLGQDGLTVIRRPRVGSGIIWKPPIRARPRLVRRPNRDAPIADPFSHSCLVLASRLPDVPPGSAPCRGRCA